ncbi:MAG: metal-dependent hydrolase [Gammaproteobacteria bacterium]|nr:metal-dependent hydrolase [Gammaproteobacteria bacterium]
MDTLTHALLGGLLVRAVTPDKGWSGKASHGTAVWVGGLAAAFPDIDYLSFWLNPLLFLADWHRGPTHSLLMAPVWALLMSLLFARVLQNALSWRSIYVISLLALLSHIVSDCITAFGTQIWWPLSDLRVAFSTTFFIDPYFSFVVLAGLILSITLPRPGLSARLGLLVLTGYLTGQAILQQQARSIGEAYIQSIKHEQSTAHALPQPLSPFNWMIIVPDQDRYDVALVNLGHLETSQQLAERLGWLGDLWLAYRPVEHLIWQTRHLYGTRNDEIELVKVVWSDEKFTPFRRFAKFPVIYRLDLSEGERCVWFTDLRYVLPDLTPPFRYGMCDGEQTDTWQLYRLRRSTENARHFLG